MVSVSKVSGNESFNGESAKFVGSHDGDVILTGK